MSEQKKKRIVIIGGGFAGVYALKNLHKFFHRSGLKKNVEISLISKKNYFLFTPLLHEVATGSLNPENIIEPIREMLRCCLDSFFLGEVLSVDFDKKKILMSERELEYDYLVLALGSETNFYGISGAEENSFTLKSLEDALKIKNSIIAKAEKAISSKDIVEKKQLLSFVIAGGGPTGVEFAGELLEFLHSGFGKYFKKAEMRLAQISLVQKDKELLPSFDEKIRKKTLEILQKKGIHVFLNSSIKEVSPFSVTLDSGEEIPASMVVWTAGVKPAGLDLIANNPIEKVSGKIKVNQYLQIPTYPEVFSAGDGAFIEDVRFPRGVPALAQTAEAEAKKVAENIFLSFSNKNLSSFSYQHKGDMISLGQWMALGKISGVVFWGRIAWWFWRTLYLSKMISFRKKIRVAFDWTLDLFFKRDVSEF